MKILLISSNIARSPYPIYPLGLGMVAAALRNAGYETALFDFFQQGQSMAALASALKKNKPRIIGISIRNIDNVNLLNECRYIDVVKRIVRKVREETDAVVVLGGSGFSIMPEVILRAVGADYGIVGEGEKIMVEFTAGAAKGKFPRQRCLRAKPELKEREIPPAYYENALMTFYLKNGQIAPVQTKRGCGHNCIYCTYPLLEGRSIRPRDPRAVVDDIELLTNKHKAKYIFFTDSVFNDTRGHFLDVVKEMKKRQLSVSWTAFFKPQGLDDDNVRMMKETGLKAAEIGSDASTDATLAKLKKGFRFKDITDCNNLFSRHGIATAHYFMFGCPGETQKTAAEGIKNIINLKKTVSFIFMGIRILPGTGLARIAVKEGLIDEEQDLLEPVYYIAPSLRREWLEKKLTGAFSGIRHCIFPPDALDSSLQFLHKLGYTGSLWDMLLPRGKKRRKRNGAK